MKHVFTILILIILSNSFAQSWSILLIPTNGRIDDIFFPSLNEGWAAGGDSNRIFKTIDGGLSWEQKAQFPNKYLRSIEFVTPSLGFCGSLDSSFYRTTDGGETWVDIAHTINPKPKGICGLSAPTENVIYGCGVWSMPAFVIKSTDGGNTWTSINMSAYANSLVDVHFVDANHGFVSGKAADVNEGGIILYTADGGNTWETKFKTQCPNDYVWKLQTYNNKNLYGSIESGNGSLNVRWLHSYDFGSTWGMDTIPNQNTYVQTIGFLDSLHGWTGGGNTLLETVDGGATWQSLMIGTAFNRFFAVNGNTAYLSGSRVYKYYSGVPVSISENKDETYDEMHSLSVFPNPTDDVLNIDLNMRNKTFCQLGLYDMQGKLLQSIINQRIEQGATSFSVSVKEYPSQTLFLMMKTNEGNIYRQIIKK